MLKGRDGPGTGSLDGVGYAIAAALAPGQRGDVDGIGDAALVEERVDELRKLGVKADYDDADLSDAAQVEALVAATESRLGRLTDPGQQRRDPATTAGRGPAGREWHYASRST